MQILGHNTISSVLLAPMAGVADAAFRIICRELGFRGLMFTEMVSAKGLCFGDAKSFELARIREAERPIGIQLFGGEPDVIARAIKLLSDYGADLFDINMGCPMPKITRNGEGAALMLDPARAQAIVSAAAGASSTPVSVKIRKGWDGEHANAVEFAKRLEDAGAAIITVHGRARDQMYGGRADRRIIADVKQAVRIPVVGNGDVSCAEEAISMLHETDCDAVMIGRAVRGNPWLPRDVEEGIAEGSSAEDGIAEGCSAPTVAGYSVSERIRVMKRHLELAILYKGERTGVLEMRKHLAWYTRGRRGAASVRNEIFRLTDYDGALRCIDNLS